MRVSCSVFPSSDFSYIIHSAKNTDDRIRPYLTRISSLGIQGKLEEALNQSIDIIEELGESVPRKTTIARTGRELIKTAFLLRGKSNEYILSLPVMRNKDKMACLKFLSFASTLAFFSGHHEMLGLIGMRIVQLTLKYGLSYISADGFSLWGIVRAQLGSRKDAYRYGQLSLELAGRLSEGRPMCAMRNTVHGCITHWKQGTAHCIEPLMKTYTDGLRQGDMWYGLIGGLNAANAKVVVGKNLKECETLLSKVCRNMDDYGQEHSYQLCAVILAFVQNMRGQNDDPTVLPNTLMEKARATNHEMAIYSNDYHHFKLACFFQDWNRARAFARRLKRNRSGRESVQNHFSYTEGAFLMALSSIVKYGLLGRRTKNRRAHQTMRQFGRLAKEGKSDCTPMVLFLGAEEAYQRRKGSIGDTELQSLFCDAADACRTAGFHHYQAFAFERAATIFAEKKKVGIAINFLSDAMQLYDHWGGSEKYKHLEAYKRGIIMKSAPTQDVSGSSSESDGSYVSEREELMEDLSSAISTYG